jgi:hypothetical protein
VTLPDPSDPDFDPWADDPAAPKEPGSAPAGRGPAALLDPDTRGRIEQEILYQQTRAALSAAGDGNEARRPRGDRAAAVSVLVVAAAVVLAAALVEDFRPAGQLVLAVIVHELGHLLGMLALGVRDKRAFFVPFLASLGPSGMAPTSAGRQAVVALLGPLPGLFVGVAVYAMDRPSPGSWLADLCVMLVGFNAIHLLPVAPLDGGRLFDLLGPTRRPGPGAAGRLMVAVAIAATAVLAADWRLAIPLGMLAGVVFVAIPIGLKAARSGAVLRRLLPGLPADPAAMTDPQRRKVFGVALMVYPVPDPDRLAAVVRAVHTRASEATPGPAATAALLAAYAAGLAAAVAFVGWAGG